MTNKREFPLDKTRNIGTMVHIDAGKTTTTERILYYTGKTHKIGETHEDDPQMDWMDEEKEHGITVAPAAITAQWKDYRINTTDTPGYVGSAIEIERSLRVLDGAVTVLDAQAGVEPQAENVWRQAETYDAPRIAFANKMDKTGVNFDKSVRSLHECLNTDVHAVQTPIGSTGTSEGVISLINMVADVYDEDRFGLEWDITPAPNRYKEEALKRRSKLIKAAADVDDGTIDKYLDGEEISNDELKAAIHKATLSLGFFPVHVGSVFKNKGV